MGREDALSSLTFADSADPAGGGLRATPAGLSRRTRERARGANGAANGLAAVNAAFNYVVNRSTSAIQVTAREPEFNITLVIIAL